MEVLFDQVAGLEIGKKTLTVCLRTPRAARLAGGDADDFDHDPLAGGDAGLAGRVWLTVAATESTSTYWKPAFYCMEEVLVVWLPNAAHIMAISRRRTDVKDAEWIAQLLEHGLRGRASVPPPEIRRLRMLVRYRVQLMSDRRGETTRLEGRLAINLSSVAAP